MKMIIQEAIDKLASFPAQGLCVHCGERPKDQEKFFTYEEEIELDCIFHDFKLDYQAIKLGKYRLYQHPTSKGRVLLALEAVKKKIEKQNRQS